MRNAKNTLRDLVDDIKGSRRFGKNRDSEKVERTTRKFSSNSTYNCDVQDIDAKYFRNASLGRFTTVVTTTMTSARELKMSKRKRVQHFQTEAYRI